MYSLWLHLWINYMHVQAYKQPKVIWRYMESLDLHTGAPTLHWEDNTSCIYVVKVKNLLIYLNTFACLSGFYTKELTMVYLFQNMRSLVSFRKICAPKHIQVQLSVGITNGWPDSDYIWPLIQNTINSWDYMIFLWTEWIIKITQISYVQWKFNQRYYVNFLISEYLQFNRQVHASIWWSKNIIEGTFSQIYNQNILSITNIYYQNKTPIISSETKCEDTFSDPGVGSYVSIFFSVTYLVYILFLIVCCN